MFGVEMRSKLSTALTEDRVLTLIDMATKHAVSSNLDVSEYVSALINPNTIGSADAGQVVETLIKYHEEWLRKSKT